MRLLFFVLLLANLALFAWTQWLAPEPAATPTASAALDVPRILLVGEQAPQHAGAAVPEALPEPAAAGEPEADAAPSAAGASAAAAELTAAGRCVSVGPLTDLETAARVTRVLTELGYTPRQRPADGLVPAGYIVLVSGLAGPEDQARVRRRLERGGLTDAAALPAPVVAPDAQAAPADGGAYAVSAGLFSERRRAERRAEVVRQSGFTPTIEERRVPGTVYWLDLELRSPAAPEALQDAALGAGGLQVLPCPATGPAATAIR